MGPQCLPAELPGGWVPASVVLGLGWGRFFAAGGLEMWSFISLAVSDLNQLLS